MNIKNEVSSQAKASTLGEKKKFSSDDGVKLSESQLYHSFLSAAAAVSQRDFLRERVASRARLFKGTRVCVCLVE